MMRLESGLLFWATLYIS